MNEYSQENEVYGIHVHYITWYGFLEGNTPKIHPHPTPLKFVFAIYFLLSKCDKT